MVTRLRLVSLASSFAVMLTVVAAAAAAAAASADAAPAAAEDSSPSGDSVFVADPAVAADPLDDGFARGMTVSCPTWGPIWGSDAMRSSLAELKELGVDWVSIHPYAQIDRSGTVRYAATADTPFLRRAVEIARAADIHLFWKPHLAYWGSFDWRGTIEFGDDEAAWRRFFTSYRAFIVDQARFAEAAGVPLFAVGLEYEATTHHEADWRRLIQAVRAVYSGRITYAANWDRLDDVPFWDAVDLIGVQAYFPLGAADAAPDVAAFRQAWDAPLARLEALSTRYDKPVLFAEIGYDLAEHAAAEPWRTQRGRRASPRALALRAALMRAALERVPEAPHVVGMFWWKWIPGRPGRHDFPMEHPEAREILRSAWRDTALSGR
ncbi:MAG: hypothetical protein AAGC60_08870 [Acidobacteriota bacterium]